MLTKLKKPEFDAFHSNDDADTDITKVSIQSSLKSLITEISEKKDLLRLLLYNAEHNSKPMRFKSNKKWSKVVVVYNMFHHKKISGSNIYAKSLFLHALTGYGRKD